MPSDESDTEGRDMTMPRSRKGKWEVEQKNGTARRGPAFLLPEKSGGDGAEQDGSGQAESSYSSHTQQKMEEGKRKVPPPPQGDSEKKRPGSSEAPATRRIQASKEVKEYKVPGGKENKVPGGKGKRSVKINIPMGQEQDPAGGAAAENLRDDEEGEAANLSTMSNPPTPTLPRIKQEELDSPLGEENQEEAGDGDDEVIYEGTFHIALRTDQERRRSHLVLFHEKMLEAQKKIEANLKKKRTARRRKRESARSAKSTPGQTANANKTPAPRKGKKRGREEKGEGTKTQGEGAESTPTAVADTMPKTEPVKKKRHVEKKGAHPKPVDKDATPRVVPGVHALAAGIEMEEDEEPGDQAHHAADGPEHNEQVPMASSSEEAQTPSLFKREVSPPLREKESNGTTEAIEEGEIVHEEAEEPEGEEPTEGTIQEPEDVEMNEDFPLEDNSSAQLPLDDVTLSLASHHPPEQLLTDLFEPAAENISGGPSSQEMIAHDFSVLLMNSGWLPNSLQELFQSVRGIFPSGQSLDAMYTTGAQHSSSKRQSFEFFRPSSLHAAAMHRHISEESGGSDGVVLLGWGIECIDNLYAALEMPSAIRRRIACMVHLGFPTQHIEELLKDDRLFALRTPMFFLMGEEGDSAKLDKFNSECKAPSLHYVVENAGGDLLPIVGATQKDFSDEITGMILDYVNRLPGYKEQAMDHHREWNGSLDKCGGNEAHLLVEQQGP